MTALREAAQQALEFCESVHGGCTDSNDGTVEAITIWCPELIEALRAALKQEEEASAWLAERKEYWRKEKEKMMKETNNLRAALAQQAEPVDADAAYQRWLGQTHAPALRRMDSQGAFAAGWQAALAQQAEPQDAELSAALGWPGGISEPVLDRKTLLRQVADLRSALAQQAEPVERGAAYGDALRWAIKACGALQRDDGVWFGDDAAAKLARILSEGISPPQQTEQKRGMAQPSERTNGQQTARRIA